MLSGFLYIWHEWCGAPLDRHLRRTTAYTDRCPGKPPPSEWNPRMAPPTGARVPFTTFGMDHPLKLIDKIRDTEYAANTQGRQERRDVASQEAYLSENPGL